MRCATRSAASPGSVIEVDLLEVQDLRVEFATGEGPVCVAEEVSFSIGEGETFGLVGESGSGKTVTSLAILGMIRPPAGTVTGSVRLAGRELVGLPTRALREVRGRQVAMIFQEPRRSLDPAFTVGDQIGETVRAHLGGSRREARARAVEMLDLVGIPDAARRVHAYPHEFSGGMAQRVMLAIALSCSPKLLIADEPTTALDVTVQDRVLNLMKDLQAELGLSILFISHDLGVVAQMCDRIAVMYAGQIVERADALDLFLRPQHPYTAGLLRSVPRSGEVAHELWAIPGVVPPALDRPTGCRFHPRCEFAVDRCRDEVPVLLDGRAARCLLAPDLALEGIG